MIKKILNELNISLRELLLLDFKYVLTLFLIVIICFLPMNYYVVIGGGIDDVGNRVQVNDGYKGKGSFNISYVTQADGVLLTYLMSYIVPSWERESISDYKYNDKESEEDIIFRNTLSLKKASNDAIYVAFKTANKEINIKERHMYVLTKNNDYEECNLKVGDEILKIDNQDIYTFNYIEYINSLNENDYVEVLVNRDNKEQTIKTKIYKDKDRLLIGVYLQELREYTTNPKVKIKFKSKESGPSGGLITTLSIYNQLVSEDITKGLTIAGTGTIDSEGNIGEIGGVEYKVLGAVKGKADVFLVPHDNYKEVMKVVNKKKLKIKVIEVNTFEETLKKLNELKK